MNRRDRRAARIRDPKGNTLEPQLLLVLARDELGRPTTVRIAYDDERLGDVLEGKRNPEMLLVWMHPNQWRTN